jgi:urea transporter
MLQRNAMTGLLFIVAIGVNSPIMLLGGTMAVLSAMVIAYQFQYDAYSVNSGLYGFNAALSGIAVFFLLPLNVLSITLVIVTGVLSTIIMHFMLIKLPKIRAFTAPFIISTGCIILLVYILGIEKPPSHINDSVNGLFYTVMRGIGQITFQDNWLSGLILLVGLFVQSYKVVMWALVGSCLGLITARMFYLPDELMYQGLYGYNASLTAIALASIYSKQIWPVFLGVFISIILTYACHYLAITVLTMPFVLASWLVIFLFKANDTVVNS